MTDNFVDYEVTLVDGKIELKNYENSNSEQPGLISRENDPTINEEQPELKDQPTTEQKIKTALEEEIQKKTLDRGGGNRKTKDKTNSRKIRKGRTKKNKSI